MGDVIDFRIGGPRRLSVQDTIADVPVPLGPRVPSTYTLIGEDVGLCLASLGILAGDPGIDPVDRLAAVALHDEITQRP